jgi:hypothetical protein
MYRIFVENVLELTNTDKVHNLNGQSTNKQFGKILYKVVKTFFFSSTFFPNCSSDGSDPDNQNTI